MGKTAKIVNSPYTLIFICVATFFVAVAWYSVRQIDVAPSLPNWNWADHSDALLVYYKPPNKGCVCSDDIRKIAEQAKSQGLAVLLVASTKADLSDLSLIRADQRILGLQYQGRSATDVRSSTVVLRIQNQRITKRFMGTTLPVGFFDK
jgi:hypothetical protein